MSGRFGAKYECKGGCRNQAEQVSTSGLVGTKQAAGERRSGDSILKR